MEKTKNKFYVASAVLDFVFASIFVLHSLIMIMAMTSVAFWAEVEGSLIEEYGAGAPEILEQVEMIKTMFIWIIVFALATSVVMYVAGAYFIKYSNLTDQEAEEKWGKCLAWVIVSYFFGGLLIGGLATAGLCAVQAKQRNRIIGGTATWTTSTGKTVDINTGNVEDKTEDVLAPENLEKIKVRLEKLKELKDVGAITDEEFDLLRAKTMSGLTIKKEEPKVNPEEEKINKMTERLNKLATLKETGAITEEEYASLREKVINETK